MSILAAVRLTTMFELSKIHGIRYLNADPGTSQDPDSIIGKSGSWIPANPTHAASKLFGNQPVIPAHERIGCRRGGNLFETCAAKWMGSGSEAAALGVGEPQVSSAMAGFQKTKRFVLVGDDLLLVPSDPAGDHGNEDVQYHGESSG